MSLHALSRFDDLSPGDATDAALLARVLGEEPRAAALLEAMSLPRLLRAGRDELKKAGLDDEAAGRLRAALELGRRAVDQPLVRGVTLRCATDVAAHLRGRLLSLEQEQLHVLGLDSKNRLLVHAVAATGRINQVYASGSDVFRPLVREAAAGAIVVHNHPSGDHAPSDADVDLTNRLAEIGALLAIPLLDHIVMGRDGEFSFAHHGLLPRTG